MKRQEKEAEDVNEGFNKTILPLIRQHFFSKGIKKVRITYYKSMVRPIERPYEGRVINLDEGLILFFDTVLKYPLGGASFPVATEHNYIPAVLFKTGEFFTSKGMHMAIIVDGTDENKASETQNYLEGILSIPWKNAPYYSRIASCFVLEDNNKIKSQYASPVFLNPSCPGQKAFTDELLDILGEVYSRISSSLERRKITAAMKWFRLAYPNYLITESWTGGKEFILCWTALEALCGGSKVVSIIKNKFSQYYKISKKEVEGRIGIGKLYDIRCRILHKGMNYSVPSYQTDIVRETFIIYLGLLLHIKFGGFSLTTILEGKAEYMPYIFEFKEIR